MQFCQKRRSGMKKKLQTAFTTRQYMLSKDFEIYYYNEKYTSKIEMHTHNYYEFYFFIEGDVQIQIENEIYPLKCGDMVIIPPGRRHRAVVEQSNCPYRRFVFWVSREYAGNLMEQSAEYGYLMQQAQVQGKLIYSHDVVEFNTIQYKIFQLIEETQMERYGREARIPLLVSDLILHLNREIYEKEHPVKIKEENLYQNLIYYIEQNLEEDLCLEKLSSVFFVSRYYIAHIFKEQAGISVHQYILKKRMQACREAILGGENISKVYERYGFQDYSSFYRAFRKEYGMSPKEYREEQKVIFK